MATLTKYITAKTVRPVIKKYLTRTRMYHYQGISLEIPPGVFHPGFFFSTKILLRYILQLDLANKKLLELGAGSGLIALSAAKKNAVVTATDINENAVEYLKINSKRNNTLLTIILSDLFEKIPQQQFDFIVINPPFYKKNPQTKNDYAWYCGEHGEYFFKLFRTLKNYIGNVSSVLMVLSDGCDIKMIEQIAAKNNFIFNCIQTKKNILEKIFIFSIESKKHVLENYSILDDVYVNNHAVINKDFEKNYLSLRKKENRVYTDDEVAQLPFIKKSHPHFNEWQVRKQSAVKLFHYLQQKNKSLKILEAGCGNGWLTNFLSGVKDSFVIGLDINFTELKQAAHVFKKNNINFVYDELSGDILTAIKFDIVVFAASAQYFASLHSIISMILPLLNEKGEIHFIDTNFYSPENVVSAQKRSEVYYSGMGFPGLTHYYHHHCMSELESFDMDILYDPTSVKNIFRKNKNPFPWVRIRK